MHRELSNKNNRIIQIIVFTIVIAIQIAVICHWASKRSNYFVDELFSFGYAHSYTFDKKNVGYIDNSPEWKYEEWISNKVLKTQLEVSEEESLLNRNPVSALKLLLTRRNYFGLLNMIMAAFSSGKVSLWPPVIFNLIIFVLSQLLLYRIVSGMTHSFGASLLAVFMYGLSGTAISTHLFVRFYALVTLMILGCVRLHQKMWQEKRMPYFALECIFGMLLLYLALKNSELVLVLGGGVVAAFTVALLVKRRYREAVFYILLIVPASLLFLIKKTNLIDIVLHPEAYQNKGGATGWITDNLLSTNLEKVISRIFLYLRWFSEQVFGSWYVLCSFLVLILILLEIRFLGRKKAPDQSDLSAEERSQTDACQYAWVIFGACAVYYVFAILTGLRYTRYFSLFFPLTIALLWTLVGILTKELKYRSYVYVISFVLICIGGVSLQLIRPEVIENIYTEDQALIDTVRDTDIHNVVVICTDREDANHSIYDCIHLLPYEAELYPVNMEHHHIDAAACPDQVLVWSNGAASSEEYTKDLSEAGYSLEVLGTTHTSVVYVARKN